MAGKKGQKKRVWSDEEKLSICAQSRVAGVSIAQVARRYAMNTNLIHKWLRDPRFAPGDAVVDLVSSEEVRFLPSSCRRDVRASDECATFSVNRSCYCTAHRHRLV